MSRAGRGRGPLDRACADESELASSTLRSKVLPASEQFDPDLYLSVMHAVSQQLVREQAQNLSLAGSGWGYEDEGPISSKGLRGKEGRLLLCCAGQWALALRSGAPQQCMSRCWLCRV